MKITFYKKFNPHDTIQMRQDLVNDISQDLKETIAGQFARGLPVTEVTTEDGQTVLKSECYFLSADTFKMVDELLQQLGQSQDEKNRLLAQKIKDLIVT